MFLFFFNMTCRIGVSIDLAQTERAKKCVLHVVRQHLIKENMYELAIFH